MVRVLEKLILGRRSLFLHLALSALTYFILATSFAGLYFRGGDGGFFAILTTVNLDFLKNPFTYSPVSPFEGMSGFVTPLNVWLSPSFLARAFIEDEFFRSVLPFLIFAVTAFLSVFALGRSTGFTRTEAIFGAWLGVLFAVPLRPWSSNLGLHGIPYIQIFVIGNFAVAAFLAVGRQRAVWQNLAAAACVFILALWAILFSATYASVGGVTFGFMIVGALFFVRKRREVIWKSATVFVIVSIFFILGLPEYFQNLVANTARIMFSDEIQKTSIFQQTAEVFRVSLLGVASLAAAIVATSNILMRKTRCLPAAAAFLLPYATILVGSAVFLVAGGVRVPGPYQFEYFLFGFYALFIAHGVFNIVPVVFSRGAACLGWGLGIRPAKVAVVAVLIVFFVYEFRSPLYGFVARPWPQTWTTTQTDLTRFLASELAVTNGSPWKGSAVSFIGSPGSPPDDRLGKTYGDVRVHFGNGHADNDLRLSNIPVLEADNSFMSPANYIFITRLLRQGGHPRWKNYLFVNRFRPRLLRAMGVRYLVDDVADVGPDWFPVRQLASSDGQKILYLFDLGKPNIGNFSPVEVVVSSDVSDMLARMDDPQFDFRRQVIVGAPVDVPLAKATKTELSIEKDGFRIRAASPGVSLLALPLQFSSCLEWTSLIPGAHPVKLIRANLIHTGLLFRGEIDGYIAYRFGPLAPSDCRRRDQERLTAMLRTGG